MKRARSASPTPILPDLATSFLARIVVISGSYDDADPVVKYWDPELCVNEKARAFLTKCMQKPSRELLYYLLTGEIVKGDEILTDSVTRASPEALGVRTFPREEQCALDF